MFARITPLIALFAVRLAGVSYSAEPTEGTDFARDIQPILAAHCTECHGPKKQENGLRLDYGAVVLRGGDSGPAVIAGKAKQSLLLQAILGNQRRGFADAAEKRAAERYENRRHSPLGRQRRENTGRSDHSKTCAPRIGRSKSQPGRRFQLCTTVLGRRCYRHLYPGSPGA